MINNDRLIQEFTSTVTQFYSYLEKINKLNMLNAAVAAEKWVAAVCSILFSQDFKRSSIFTANADSYDLEGGPIAIQVTSNMDAAKIIKTVTDFERRQHAVAHPTLYVFLLGDRPKYTSKELDPAIAKVSFTFHRDQHIIGTDELLALVANLDIAPLKRIVEVTNAYFEQQSADLQRQRSDLRQDVAAYKDSLRPVFARISDAKALADKFSHQPRTSASCNRIKGVLTSTETFCNRALELFSTIAEATSSAMPWQLNYLVTLALTTANDVHTMDIHLENIMRGMERTWELGSLIVSMEASDKRIAKLQEELKQLDKEQNMVEVELQSLEFEMKFLAA